MEGHGSVDCGPGHDGVLIVGVHLVRERLPSGREQRHTELLELLVVTNVHEELVIGIDLDKIDGRSLSRLINWERETET